MNPNLKKIDDLLSAAENIMDRSEAFPCLRFPNGRCCLRLQTDKGVSYDRVKESDLCASCATHWHISRARCFLMFAQRAARGG